MENSEHPSSSSGQNRDPLRQLRRNRRRRLERRPRSELSRLALPLRLPSLTAAPGLALCRLLLRSRHLECHSRRSEFLSDGPQLRFAPRHLGCFSRARLGSLGRLLQPPLPACLRSRRSRGVGAASAEPCNRRPSAHRGGPLVSRNPLVRSGSGHHIDSGVQAIRRDYDACRSHCGIHRNSRSIPSSRSRSSYSCRQHQLRRSANSRRR